MMVPDYRLIAEVSLYANGYQDAAALAVNLVSVLKVCGGVKGCVGGGVEMCAEVSLYAQRLPRRCGTGH